MIYLSLIFLILNYIYLASAFICTGCKTYFINNKLYYVGYFELSNFFYVDLTGVPLNDDTIIDSSRWFSLPLPPDPNCTDSPFLGGKANDKLFFTTENSFDIKNYLATENFDSKNVSFIKNLFAFKGEEVKYIDIFDTTLNKWETKISFTGTPSEYFLDFRLWISDNKTGKSYSFQWISEAIDIFDTINFNWSISTPIPLKYSDYIDSSLYGPPQVLLPDGKIIYIGGHSSYLLTYDTNNNSWGIIVKTF